MQAFVTAYNTLMDTMGALYEHNTYTDGNNNYDGGRSLVTPCSVVCSLRSRT